jgi:hypothetical protein
MYKGFLIGNTIYKYILGVVFMLGIAAVVVGYLIGILVS